MRPAPGWLYYIAGNTQEEIASKLGRFAPISAAAGVSGDVRRLGESPARPPDRQLPVAGGRVEENSLRSIWPKLCRLIRVPMSTTIGIAQAASAEIEKWLRSEKPITMAIGTGRTLKAAVEQLPRMDCSRHKVVSLTGNVAPDGSAAYYNVIFNIADALKARSFPMPLPVFATSTTRSAICCMINR